MNSVTKNFRDNVVANRATPILSAVPILRCINAKPNAPVQQAYVHIAQSKI